MSDHLIAQHTPFTSDQWAERWQQEADARNALFLEKKQLEHELAASQAGQAELLARLEERTESHLAASARDVQTIQRQAVEISKWQSLAEMLAQLVRSALRCQSDKWNDISATTLAAYESAKVGLAAFEPAGLAVDSVALARALLETRDIQVYGDGCSTQERDTWILAKMIDTALAAKAGGLPAPLAEAVKPCDWKEDEDGNWYTSCHQFMCFEHAPPNEHGYKFCHRCGHPTNFVEFTPPLDEPPSPA